eukprot:1161394-Pelagomonas_calceolata.AAC.11
MCRVRGTQKCKSVFQWARHAQLLVYISGHGMHNCLSTPVGKARMLQCPLVVKARNSAGVHQWARHAQLPFYACGQGTHAAVSFSGKARNSAGANQWRSTTKGCLQDTGQQEGVHISGAALQRDAGQQEGVLKYTDGNGDELKWHLLQVLKYTDGNGDALKWGFALGVKYTDGNGDALKWGFATGVEIHRWEWRRHSDHKLRHAAIELPAWAPNFQGLKA